MQRKVFSAEFKAKVALEALAGRKTVNEIGGLTRCIRIRWRPGNARPRTDSRGCLSASGAGGGSRAATLKRCMARSGGCKCRWSG